MISLRNQHYDEKFLILVDLDLRIDYLVPFIDKTYLNNERLDAMQMDDASFICSDVKNQLSHVTTIDYSSDIIGKLDLISITSASDFMNQATFCDSNVSVFRMKDIKERSILVRKDILNDRLVDYSNVSPRVSTLYEFNDQWIEKMHINQKTKCLDFSSDKIEAIVICKYNAKGIVITATEDGCSFNGQPVLPGHQYSISFEILDRSGNSGSEYFMQKVCACHLNSLEQELTTDFITIINENT